MSMAVDGEKQMTFLAGATVWKHAVSLHPGGGDLMGRRGWPTIQSCSAIRNPIWTTNDARSHLGNVPILPGVSSARCACRQDAGHEDHGRQRRDGSTYANGTQAMDFDMLV